MLSSNFQEYGFSQQIPVIARSEAELVEMLRLWMRKHNGKLPPGATKGSKIVVEVFVAKELMFVGTREMILVDRFLVNETTIGWILRARDGSCMMTTHNNGNNGSWRGYKAWLGGDCGFTDTILVSSDGKRHRSSISNDNTELRNLDMIYRNTGVSNDSLKNTKNAVNPNCHSTTTETLYVGLSHKGTIDRDGLKASDTRDARAVKSKIEGHRYPTQKRRLASFGNSFEAWEAQGNRGEHTPPTSSFNTIEGYHWPTQHPGTPPITPQQQSKRRQPPHKLHEAACLQPIGYRSPSIELTSVHQASPRRRGRPRKSKFNGSYPIGYRSPSIELTSVHQASPRRRGRPRKSKFNGSYPEKKEGRLISATKLPLSPKTPPRASNAITKHTPSSPTSKFLVSPATISEPYQASQIVFHFFLSNEGFGAIPKLFAQCATPKCFFKEAKAAYHALGKSTDKSRLLGVKVTIEGVTRPIVILWESEDGFERMVEAMANEVVGRIGNLNVEVRGIKMGQAMWEVGVST